MIKLLSLFSGIGAFESALKRCGRPYEVVNYCEIDQHASRSYSQIHGVPVAQRLEPNTNGVSNTLTTVQKDNYVVEPAPKILQIGNLMADDSRKFTNPQTGRVYDPQGLSPTINTAQGGQREVKIIETTPEAYRIRKLTPRECYRLMGFTDAEFDRIKGVSNTQLYKQAGNSIVVNVLEAIFKQLPI